MNDNVLAICGYDKVDWMNTKQFLNEIDRENVAVMEALVEPKLRVFILPDGNVRDKQKNDKNYSDGGNNVVKTVQSLLERGDVELAVFGILSRENIEKRKDDFFDELYVAFLKLGLGMEMEQILIRDGVRLYLEGSLSRLRNKGSSASRLADMIELVISKTEVVEKPRIEVGFGIDYMPSTLIDRKINVVFRSGMETPNAFRSSGLDVDRDMACVSSVDLWPSMSPQKLNGIIDTAKTELPQQFAPHQTGIIKVIDERRVASRKLSLSVKCADDFETARQKIDTMILENRDLIQRLNIYYLQGGVWRPLFVAGEDVKNTVLFYPAGGSFGLDPTRKFSFVVAPGQSGKIFFPAPTALNYSTVISSQNTIEGIRKGILSGFDFVDNVPSLKGAQRELKTADAAHDWKEFDYLKKTKGNYEDAGELCEYNQLADQFAHRCINWAKSRGVTFEKPEQLRASLNYAYTCYFMANFGAKSNKFGDNAESERLAMNLAMYMFVTYLWDDRIYDLDIDHDKKVNELKFATESLTNAVDSRSSLASLSEHKNKQTFHIVKSLVIMIADLGTSLDRVNSSNWIARRWRKKMVDLIDSHHQEYFYKNNQPFESEVIQDVSKLADKSQFIAGRLLKADVAEKKMWNYLQGIEESIGASMTFEILIASLPNVESMPEAVLKKFEEVFSLINFYYRLLNDAAEVFRPSYDKESGDNAVVILSERYKPEDTQAMFKTTVDVLNLSRQLKVEIINLRAKLLNDSKGMPWERLAIAIVRSDIAELFYKNTHYRVAKRDKVSAFFAQMYKSGIDEQK